MLFNKRKWKKRVCVLATCMIICGAAVGFGIRNLDNSSIANAEECELVINEWEESYMIGDTLMIPDAVIRYEDKEYVVDSTYLQYPDGSVEQRDSYVLNRMGTYTVIYVATVDNVQLKVGKDFDVLSDAYMVEDASYTYLDKLNMNETTFKSGLETSISTGGSFRFNVPVNVKDFSKDEAIAIVYPYNRTKLMGNNGSVTEARKVIVRLTDCYDESVYVDVVLSWDFSNTLTGNRHPYFRAGASTQTVIGLQKAAPTPTLGSAWINGEHYRVFDYDQYGSASKSWGSPSADNCGYSIFYDDGTKEIYVQDAAGKYFVNDLDEVAVYDKNLFKGFTTGDVYISVLGDDYYMPKLNVEIEQLGNYRQTDFATLSAQEDTEKPFIEVDVDTSKPIYIAKDGVFEIFGADYRDYHKGSPIKSYVYYDYGTDNQTQVPLVEGKFTPNKNGLYTIEYVAVDVYGNESSKTVDLHCVDGNEGKIVSLETTKLTTLKGGYEYELPAYTLDGVNGGEYIRIVALCNGKTVEIDKESRKFFVEELGEYEIIYQYGDAYHDYEYSYKITAESSDAIVFKKPILPLYFIKNAPYSLDNGTVNIYSGESVKEETIVDVYCKQGTGEFEKVADLQEVVITGMDSVQFRYHYGDNVVFSDEIPVVDVGIDGQIQIQNYFVGDFESSALPTNVYYQSKKTQGNVDNALEFINAIGLSNFALKFNVPQDNDNFNKLTITLCDYYNRDNVMTIEYGKSGSASYFSVNGGVQQLVEKKYAGETWSIEYNEKQGAFAIGDNIEIPCENTFSSDRILLKITLNGINGQSGISILQVNNQVFNVNIVKDNIRPMIKTDVRGEYELGSIITIMPATATDVLTPYFAKKFTFKVVAPSGVTVTSLDGVVLNEKCSKTRAYEFKIEEEGVYYVSYTYKDFANKSMTIDMPLRVFDNEAPTITIADGLNETSLCKVAYNSVVTVADFTVTDNRTMAENLKTYVIVYSPKGEKRVLADTNEFVAERKGLYKICYYCIDEVGNMAVRFYNVEVA